jgi:Domain of unknown function (DUF4157)
MATNDATVNAALDEVAKKFGITRADALKVVVGQGLQQMTSNLGARAFTQGSDTTFSMAGDGSVRKVQAHELTHVIQQSTARLKSQP